MRVRNVKCWRSIFWVLRLPGWFSAALPSHPDEQREDMILTGEIPRPLNPPAGCRFHPRCPLAMSVCSEVEPTSQLLDNGQQVACHLYTEQ